MEPVLRHFWPSFTPETAPNNWLFDFHADPLTPITLHFGLKSSRFSYLLQHLNEVSDPSHQRYGDYLSKEDADALVRADEETAAEVFEWLNFHGMAKRQEGGEIEERRVWFTVPTNVGTAERMLHTRYAWYKHSSNRNTRILRTLQYSLPRHLDSCIDVIHPTTYFPSIKAMHTSRIRIANGTGMYVNVQFLKELYRAANYTPHSYATNVLGIPGFLEEYPSQSDLNTFLQISVPAANNTNYTLNSISVNGGFNSTSPSSPGMEANLDVQYGAGLIWPLGIKFWSVGGRPDPSQFIPDASIPDTTDVEPYLTWLNWLLEQSNEEIPKVITISYGDDEQTFPPEYARKVCDAFAQLGARGVSVLVASGDSGVGADACLRNDGSKRTAFIPDFPSSCPYVTSVGGTTMPYGAYVNNGTAETAAEFSGGGFSNLFGRPDWQKNAVGSYLNATGSNYKGLFNNTGRAYPDLSAQAKDYLVVVNASLGLLYGTSASTPSSLGFLNPMIYALSSNANLKAFNDVVNGSNPGCGTPGFAARKGWDPVTGVGTPIFDALQALLNK
ncbi:hypothetical protein VNI00_010750 [Paramarasmius palmivorus]|uniref:tripeptidyl-peptidase II n=1 Tax=Paramarasmius palmivorus TaxID=297713 RepID=A0AAW0CFD0_9AGAR